MTLRGCTNAVWDAIAATLKRGRPDKTRQYVQAKGLLLLFIYSIVTHCYSSWKTSTIIQALRLYRVEKKAGSQGCMTGIR